MLLLFGVDINSKDGVPHSKDLHKQSYLVPRYVIPQRNAVGEISLDDEQLCVDEFHFCAVPIGNEIRLNGEHLAISCNDSVNIVDYDKLY
ncbi:hypothetical protein DPMN_078617 [Dreissena polymorpha]|uniref:Uncharacterized protein n=1 Tax=Dreissena polymorpha TaxID=45954 RepID=A0A9D4BPB6_DREPO|nr:hypothetical protein DPMN_078617 [Dreissena polymorpha]